MYTVKLIVHLFTLEYSLGSVNHDNSTSRGGKGIPGETQLYYRLV